MSPMFEEEVFQSTQPNGFEWKETFLSYSPTTAQTAVSSEYGSTNSSQTTPSTFEHRPIAVCGVAMRLPGGVRTSDQFWDVLVNGKDTRVTIPSNRYNAPGYTDRIGKKGAIKTQWGYFLEDDLTVLDTSFFTLTKTELERTDPQQRQLLEIAREVLDNAGETQYRGKSIGCYVGTFGEDWLQMSSKETQHAGGYIMTGHGDLMLANRISFEYDLKGPSMVIKTGCSASLVGVHEACRALQFGDCTSAIVAGSNLIMGPTTTAAMTQEGILSPEGSCKTFDAAADGFARGEAVTAVYIKLLDDAVRDGNPIRAIIRGTGTNSDGPDPASTAFVECHGTGTSTGDPIETTAVGEVFGSSGVFIGSVKPNFGHSEGASGITSLIKATLALEHETIPPNIKFVTPNPKIPFAEKGLVVPVKPTPWPADRAKRISINSFGIGGSNAHVILDAAPKALTTPLRNFNEQYKHAELALVSANTHESSQNYISKIQEYALAHPTRVSDMAFTLGLRREHLPYRSYMIFQGSSAPEISPIVKSSNASPPNVVMIFSGQGAQWPEMGRELLQNDANFLEDIHEMDQILQSVRYPPTWTIAAELQKSAKTSKLQKAELAQPLTTAIQIAMVNRLRRFGIKPTAVIGHSSGEIAAAYAAGALSMDEAVISAYYRGYVTKQQTLRGGMAAVGIGFNEASKYLIDHVLIACDNSPSSVTLSGDVEQLNTVLKTIKSEQPDVLARLLKVDMAYHSHHMTILGQSYRELLVDELARQGTVRQDPSVPFFSSVCEKVIQNGVQLGPSYWESNLTSSVRFNSAVQRLLQTQSNNLFLEIGPHSTLAGPLRQICAAKDTACVYVPTMIRSENCEKSALASLGQLFQHGALIDWNTLYHSRRPLTDLPTYAWNHSGKSLWYESRLSKEWRLRDESHHSLLGLRVPESTRLEPSWRNILSLEDQPWIADHKIVNDVVFPFAAYIAMAGEALRQTTGVENGYRIRHAMAQTALVLTDSKLVEMVTHLRPLRITDSRESAWFEFTVSSYSGSTWVIHCQGEVGPFTEQQTQDTLPNDELQRKVSPSRFYQSMADIGIVYGPEFQGLSSVTCSTTKNLASAKILNPRYESPEYFFHPASIDACLQLILVAMSKGVGRNFGDLCVPTTIQDLSISRHSQEMEALAWSTDNSDMKAVCTVNGLPALSLSGLELTPLNNMTISASEPHAAARLEWSPDFEFIDHSTLFDPPHSIEEETRMQEEMTLMCMLETADRVRELDPCQPHFAKFRSWLEMENTRAADGTYPLLGQAAKDFVKMTSLERVQKIEELYKKLLGLSAKSAVATGIKRIFDNCEKIFTGQADTLDLLMQEDVLTHIYDGVSFGKSEFFRLLCHLRPTLRILEVGAGTGGTTEMILRNLVRSDGYSCYSQYTFTDISAGFFPQAKERFSHAPNMDYKVFDISQSPFDQGFEKESYDVILAPNVIHATASIKDTLNNLQMVLRPGGYLVLTELCAVVRTPNYIFGNFSGWWLGESDGRTWEPYVSVSRWDHELKQVGLTGVDTAVCDAKAPYQYCAAIVSQKPCSRKKSSISDRFVTVLCDHPEEGIAHRLINDLGASGVFVTTCRFGTLPPQGQEVISVLDLEGHFFSDITESRLAWFQDILNHMVNQEPIVWLLRPSQVKCKDPHSGHALGVARSIRAESAISFHTVEISEEELQFSNLVLRICDKIYNTDDDELLSPDKEYIVDEGIIKIGRYRPFSIEEELCQYSKDAKTTSICKLEVQNVGQLDSLQWVGEIDGHFLADEAVEIDVHAIGLNFRDLLLANGVLHTPTGAVHLGLELSGVVRRVGRKVQGVKAGSRVMAMPPYACAKSVVKVPQIFVRRIPEEMNFIEAATMPMCFSTAIESLINLGQLQKGQTVLIHSAAGGVGHAAIQIAKMIGAEIFATVGSDIKVQYLVDTFGIPRNHIFNSRSNSFATSLMHETQGRGVDIVLNSLSGDLLDASWDCVAEFGKLIELGKRDATEFGRLQMRNFLLNRSYCCVDMVHLSQKRPQRVGAILDQLVQLITAGETSAIKETAVFAAAEISDAFRHLQNSDHIGKAVVEIPADISAMPRCSQPVKVQLNSDASYLLTGGLGGLGKVISTWLVERGARSLVFLSRSAESPDNQEFLRELTSMGCSVTVVSGRAQSYQDMQTAVSKAPRPVKGVVHLAMVLQDSPVSSMPFESWTSACEPKVQGAWNIHESFTDPGSLDFFVLASSLVTVVAQPGQGNYSAANTHLEAFCQYRRSLGLPASILNICPIEGVGFVEENSFAKRNMKAQGLYFLGEKELLDFLEHSILISDPAVSNSEAVLTKKKEWTSHGQVAMGLKSKGDLNDPNTRTNWRRDRRMGFYHNRTEKIESDFGSSSELKQFLSAAADDPDVLVRQDSAEYLATEIGKKIFSFMLKAEEDLDIRLSLTQIGLDSLMAIELRRFWKLLFGIEISVLEIMAAGTVLALGSLAAEQLRSKFLKST